MSQFTTDRRTIVKGAAWTVPAISVAAAAPSLAASPPDGPNLSDSIQGEGSAREGQVLTIQPSTLRNTGTEETGGVNVVFEADVVIENLQLGAFGSVLDPSALGIGVEGLGGQTVTMTVPPTGLSAGANIAPGGEWLSPASQILTFADGSGEVNLTVTATATNGGTPFVVSQVVPANS